MKQGGITLFVKHSILYAALLWFVSSSSSCKKSPAEPFLSENSKVNQWVIENMRTLYYWNEEMPADHDLNVELGPKEFFKTILNRNDRFSWIDKADVLRDELAGISTSVGLNIGLVQGEEDAVFGYVRYVIPKAPADLAGVERGMFITQINGREMTLSNYREVFVPYTKGENLRLQLAERVENSMKVTHEVDLIAIGIEEPSVYLHKVLTTKSGIKVGYLFYNRFLNAKSSELFDAFQAFKAQGVQELIVDIRYNLGGGISVSGLLSALMMKGYGKDKVFVEYSYNEMLNARFDALYQKDPIKNAPREKSFFNLFAGLSEKPTVNTADSIHQLTVNRALDLPRVFVLATDLSASASELVINNLRPYMDVVHIGDTTIGKNEGSVTIDDETGAIDWAIQPIILKLANAQHFGDYDHGLVPTQRVDEGVNLKALGDVEDPLINAALERIDPSMMARRRATPASVLSMLRRIRNLDEDQRKARPVLVDGTIDENLFRKTK